ncbi:hypothetical protein K3495_g4870 [Podosphaera aphanis]|nr:hypothetical protein K3495_g4870 [Podosphaera aphanis]
MSTSVKRACDACHRRKVKCDGINPCRNCSSAQLSCTYNAIPQKKGPKGSRAKVISELRETQRQSSLSSKVAQRINGVASPPFTSSLAPTPGLLTSEIIKDCVEFFFANMYPTLPILHRGRLEQQILYADQNIDTYCLLTSLCAFMMIQPGMGIPGDPLRLDSLPGANIVSGNLLMQETLRVRKNYDYLEAPTLNSLATSFFLFGCYFGLDLHNKAWFHLREATTLAHVNGLQREETYLQFDAIDASRRRSLYWLLFVTERAYALQRHRPLSLQATINPPTQHNDPVDPQACKLGGFIDLVNLFRPFDEAFVTLWNKTLTKCSPNYLASLQKDLTEALPSYLNSSESQTADLRTSQQWLRTMVWQLSMQNGCLSSAHDDPSMTFQYPVDIARDLVSMTSHFSHHSMDIHGIGLIEKLFDIACSLTDVLSLLPTNLNSFSLGPRDYLHDFIGLLAVLRHGDHRFLPLLLAKVNDVLPRLVNPMLQVLPETPPTSCNNLEIFDNFGNTGIGTTGLFSGFANHGNRGNTNFKIEQSEFDRPNMTHGFPILENQKHIDDLASPVSPSIGGTSSGSEYDTPYSVVVSSPIEFSYEFPDLGSQPNSYVDDLQASKRESNRVVYSLRRKPLRSCSSGPADSAGASSFTTQTPRSVPEQVYHLHKAQSFTCGESSIR